MTDVTLTLPRGPVITLLIALLLSAAGGVQAQVADTGTYLQRMDADGDGRVSEAEYVQWMMYAFEQMDADDDGVLDASELPGGKGRPITREQQRQTLVQRFHKQDANRDGAHATGEIIPDRPRPSSHLSLPLPCPPELPLPPLLLSPFPLLPFPPELP